jgi:tRNA ligase
MFETYPALFAGKDMPTDPDMDAAIQWAMNDYTPDFKMDLSNNKNDKRGNNQNQQNSQQRGANNQQAQPAKPKKAPRMEYFSVRLDTARINSILDSLFNDKDANTARMYKQLKQTRRVQNEFHVTLIHRASAPQNQEYWDKLGKLHDACQKTNSSGAWEPELGTCDVLLERVVWDDRIMCFVVRLNGSSTLQVDDGAAGTTTTEELLFETVNPMAHVTVGTADQSIKPMESNALLQRWLNGGSGGDTGIGEVSVRGSHVVKGSVRGVLGRS